MVVVLVMVVVLSVCGNGSHLLVGWLWPESGRGQVKKLDDLSTMYFFAGYKHESGGDRVWDPKRRVVDNVFFDDGLPPPTQPNSTSAGRRRIARSTSSRANAEAPTPRNASVSFQPPATKQAAPPSGMPADAPELKSAFSFAYLVD